MIEQGSSFSRILQLGGIKTVSVRDRHSPLKEINRRIALDIDPDGRWDIPADSVEEKIISAGRSYELTLPASVQMSGKTWKVVHDPLFVADTSGKFYKLLWVRGDWNRERLVFYVQTINRLPFRRRTKRLLVEDISFAATRPAKSAAAALPDLLP